jgi:CheY-like chemotaxis protein
MSVRILIADDNASVRAAMSDVLQGAGEWEIIEAESGDEAVTKARELMPQLIILDLVMPGKDGLTASREIRKMLPHTPILMHTLYYSPQVEIEAAKTGVRKVVPKSESAALVSAVQEALHSQNGDVIPLDSNSNAVAKAQLEERIRELCAQVLTSKDDALLEMTLAQLRQALHEHIEEFRGRLAEFREIVEKEAGSAGPRSKTA